MNEFRLRSASDYFVADPDTERLVVLPGFEISQPKKPVNNIVTWVQCFSRYTAAMSKHHPECTPGFMSHLVTVLKAYNEAEHPGWQEYDLAFREKMASIGRKDWAGMDVALYQEHCASRPRQHPTIESGRDPARGKRPSSGCVKVCWLYNDGQCYLKSCTFPHLCELCQGNHPKRLCTSRFGAEPGSR